MSWDKTTINASYIDIKRDELIKKNEQFLLINLANLMNMGNNYLIDKNEIFYAEFIPMNMLICKDGVYIDKFNRTYDCDSDDAIETLFFDFDEVPDEIYLEEYFDFEHFCDSFTKNTPQFDALVDLREYKKLFKQFR